MAKIQSPLLGYNTNVRHKGKVFHIQTEDSGIAKPHVITHLFADGGRIIKSVKTSYADKLDTPDLPALVKKLMQDQHKAMFIALRDGVYDDQMEVTTRTVAIVETSQTSPFAETSPESPPTSSDEAIELDESSFVEDLPPPAPKATPPSAVPPPMPSATVLSSGRTGLRQSAGWPPASTQTAPPGGAAPSGPPPLRPQAGHATSTAPLGQPTLLASSPTSPTSSVAPGTRSDKRTPAPAPRVGIVFGERLVSERSLDEVILAYLAGELGEKPSR